MRRIIAFLISPSISAFIATAIVFFVDFIKGDGVQKDLLGNRDALAFINYLGMSCLWSYAFAVFPGLFVLLLLYKFKKRSLLAFMLAGGLAGQLFTFLAWTDGSGGLFSFGFLAIAIIFFSFGATGAAVYWCIAEKQ